MLRVGLPKGLMNAAQVTRGEGRGRIKSGVDHRVSGHDSERKALGPCGAGKFFRSVTPVVKPAKEPDKHETGLARRLLDIEVDGVGMFQQAEIGKPKAHGV